MKCIPAQNLHLYIDDKKIEGFRGITRIGRNLYEISLIPSEEDNRWPGSWWDVKFLVVDSTGKHYSFDGNIISMIIPDLKTDGILIKYIIRVRIR